ncbi:MAG: hypothetical protein L6R42_006869 [Xanthoria sp. 1 TBL-2021]|nr:MAG: hypothetical protein L6R42_006869 [Xanthoria sp. 1 TBL-2021]
MNPAMRAQYQNIHQQHAATPPTRRGGIAPVVPNPQAQREAQEKARRLQEERDHRAREMAQRRATKPTDKTIPDGIQELIVGDGVQQYKRLRDLERKLDATMMRKRLDMQESPHQLTKRHKTMRIWISNTFESLPAQESGLDPIYDFSGSTMGLYRMKIEGRLLDDEDDPPSDDDSDDEEAKKDGDALDHDESPAQKPVRPVPKQTRTKLSHFFKQITLELHRDKHTPADLGVDNFMEWKKPPPKNKDPKELSDPVLPPEADFDSLEIERRFDSTVNCTINLYRDDDRFLLSDPLADLLDSKIEDRPSIVNGIYDYIRALNLQQDDEKRAVQCDDRLRRVFNRDVIFIPDISTLIMPHCFPLPPISLPYTLHFDPTPSTDPPVPTIYDLTLTVQPPPLTPPLPPTTSLQILANLDQKLALIIQALQHSKAKHAFFTEMEKDPVGFLKRWMGSQRRDLEVILGDGVGMGRGEWGQGEGYGVGPEWRRGGEGGVWGRTEVLESVRLMRNKA